MKLVLQFEILSSLQKENRFAQVESLPQLRLAPPALYHEKVNRVTLVAGESSSSAAVAVKQNQNRQNRDRVKGSPIRFPLKSSIFGEFFFLYNFLHQNLFSLHLLICCGNFYYIPFINSALFLFSYPVNLISSWMERELFFIYIFFVGSRWIRNLWGKKMT